MHNLQSKLEQIDGRGYKAYRELQGCYHGDGFRLHIDYVQPDPFANPSRLRVEIPRAVAKYKDEWIATRIRRTAFADFVARTAARGIRQVGSGPRGTGKSGLLYIDTPGQEVLERTAVRVDAATLEIRLSVGLPARGRTIMGRQAKELLCRDIPRLVREHVLRLDTGALAGHLLLADRQQAIRDYIAAHDLVAFVANGAVLPRESGVSNRPLTMGAVPFQSPPSLEVEVPLPGGNLRGMGVPRGVTLVVGGGYHGKSTLLKALERGVYNHCSGDGREYVITDASAVKIRAEDGRRIEKVNISPFISALPYGKDTKGFSSDDASGSTSQAANIIEALEAGSKVLLIDEDTSATNFMIRDARMQALVAKEKEPITPFVDKVRHLYNDLGVSTIMVIGGSGDYLDVADTVILMDEYRPREVTAEARKVSERYKSARLPEGGTSFGTITRRTIRRSSLDSRRQGKEKVDAKGLNTIVMGTTVIDLSAVEQLVDASQTRALAAMLKSIANSRWETRDVNDVLDEVFQVVENRGLDGISPFYGQHPGDMALPRRQELAAAINRLRTLEVEQKDE